MVKKKFKDVEVEREDPLDVVILLLEVLEKLEEVLKILKEKMP